MKITVVIAAYNEPENIGLLTARLIAVLDDVYHSQWELIYVIDGTDGTLAAAQSFAARRPEIRILYHAEPRGLGNAFRKGFDAIAADTAVVVTMDADLNHQPEEIPKLVRALFDRDADIVVGSRKVSGSVTEGAPFWKRAISDLVNRLMRRMMRMPVSDQTSGYRVYRYEALRKISFRNSGFSFLPEILMRAHALGLRIVEEPIQFVFRTAGESKMKLFPTAHSYLALLASSYLSRKSPLSNVSGAARVSGAAGRGKWDRHWLSLGGGNSRSFFGLGSSAVRRFIFQPAVRFFLDKYFPAKGILFEMGCGTGESSAAVPRRSRHFAGLDFSAIALAQSRIAGPFDSRVCADICRLPLQSASIDGIWNLGVMEHFSAPEFMQALQEFRRVLKPGGIVVLFWPAEANASRWVLAPVEWLRSVIAGTQFRFFHDEVNRLKSRRQAADILTSAGFDPLEVDFSIRTFFIHMVVIGRNP
ncbi:MAG: glycosyltransferase [Bryobacteraceae bacterium]